MDYLDKLFSKENLENFRKFENMCKELSEESLSTEAVKFYDVGFERDRSKMEKFLLDYSKKKMHKKVPKVMGALKGDRTVNLVDSTRGDSLSTATTVYDMLEASIGAITNKFKLSISKFVMEYVKDHISEMSTRGPGKRIIWSKNDENDYFVASGVDKNLIIEAIKASDYINPSWQIATKPSNVLMCYQIFHYWNNMTKAEKASGDYKQSMVFLVNLIFTIRFYTSLNNNYFQFEVDEELMTKTIEQLSDRYTIKSMNTIYELIEYLAYTNIANTIELMEKPTDFNMTYYMDNLHGRINTTLKYIANAFYENYYAGDTVRTDKIQGTTDEGDTYMNIPETVSADIETITRKIVIKLSSDSTVNERILIIACKETKLGVSKMKSTIASMIGNDKDLIGDLIRKIITYYIGYLKKDRKTIKSINFISLMKRTYNVSNTKEKGLLDIKEALDVLMKRNSQEYLKTSRVATLSNMKATCFYYWLLYINDKCE
ncbi:MAG: hypothetical protein ACRC5M_06655 [Anaeroplasmataceae bacterium]